MVTRKVADRDSPVDITVFKVVPLEPRKFKVKLPDALLVKYRTDWVVLSKLIVPVAAVAETVATSSIFVALWLAFEEVPLKV